LRFAGYYLPVERDVGECSEDLETYFIVLLVLTIVYSLGIYYLNRGFRKKYSVATTPQPSVSIIVSMHNEEKNVSGCLDNLLMQEYPKDKFEVIIVNDRSSDKTGEIVDTYCQKSSILRKIVISKIQDDFAPKKYAIDQALKAAKGDIILLTDADGRPSPLWVKQIISYFTEDVGLVIGYAPYGFESSHISIWNRLLSLEYLSHAAVAAASCGLGYPVTCVGTNMAYRKSLYNQLGGFGIYKSLHTGDDDLFLQRVREETDWKVVYASKSKSHVYNAPPDRWQKFFQQRIRYASKGFRYPAQVTLILILFYILNLFLLVSPLSLIICPNFFVPFLAAFFLKAISDLKFLKSASNYLEDKRFLALFPIAFILHIPYVVFFGLLAQIMTFNWAGHSS
jgi:cellulose synthase/poly-beta-1,6-N-acetylglucosamine synthase-like glycosyltransferase